MADTHPHSPSPIPHSPPTEEGARKISWSLHPPPECDSPAPICFTQRLEKMECMTRPRLLRTQRKSQSIGRRHPADRLGQTWSSHSGPPRRCCAGHCQDRAPPLAAVDGFVIIGEHIFVATGASIHGDEGQHIFIGNDSNVQDGVVAHGLEAFEGWA